jgi:hypothetical protein
LPPLLILKTENIAGGNENETGKNAPAMEKQFFSS